MKWVAALRVCTIVVRFAQGHKSIGDTCGCGCARPGDHKVSLAESLKTFRSHWQTDKRHKGAAPFSFLTAPDAIKAPLHSPSLFIFFLFLRRLRE
jgi:hypothetical protein